LVKAVGIAERPGFLGVCKKQVNIVLNQPDQYFLVPRNTESIGCRERYFNIILFCRINCRKDRPGCQLTVKKIAFKIKIRALPELVFIDVII